jgi:serine/threonine-protein kinase
MGWVWEAEHVTTHERYALKFLKGGKDEDRRRFLREVRAAGAIHHPNVVAVHDCVELPDASLVIVMELLHGETLGAVLVRERRISLPALAAILLPVVSALEAAHAIGIVHRDLKPDNVFLDVDANGTPRVKVLDFGVAKLTAVDGLAARTQAITGTGSMLGTPYYMSPEQVLSDKDLDARADVWSLGVVMYESLAGVRPTEAETIGRVLKLIMVAELAPITKHDADVPPDVASLIGRMLSAERDGRPSLGEVREVLEHHAAATPRTARSTPPPRSVPPRPVPSAASPPANTNSAMSMLPVRRSRARTRVVAAAAVALVAATVVVRQWGLGGPPTLATTVTTMPPPTGQPSVAVSQASAEAPAPSTAPSPVVSDVPPKATAVPVPLPRAPTSTGSSGPAAAPAVEAGAAGVGSARPAVVSQPPCEPGEVSSAGHCCPRGHVWQAGRCQRPLATSF